MLISTMKHFVMQYQIIYKYQIIYEGETNNLASLSNLQMCRNIYIIIFHFLKLNSMAQQLTDEKKLFTFLTIVYYPSSHYKECETPLEY
jgi:hypothetical protein